MDFRVLAPLFLLALPLSGCFGGGGGDAGAGESTGLTDASGSPVGEIRNTVEGWVFGPDEIPMPNVTIQVRTTEYEQLSDEGGYYRFVNLPPGDYLLEAMKDGFRSVTGSAYVSDGFTTPLNFTLQAVPTTTPYDDLMFDAGEVGCSLFMGEDPETGTYHECGDADINNRPAIVFDLDAHGAESVIQIFWEPTTELASKLTVKVETIDLGGQNVVFAHQFIAPGQPVYIGPGSMAQYYENGGRVQVSLRAGPGVIPEGLPIGFGAVTAQSFEIDFTVFYYERAPEGYDSRA